MNNNKGFTLIELVIVIIVLGILSATAVPKFINLQNDAKTSVLQGAESAMISAMSIAYSRLAIDGSEGLAEHTTPDDSDWCQSCDFKYGYPEQWSLNVWLEMTEGIGYHSSEDIDISLATIDGEVVAILSMTSDLNQSFVFDKDNCYLTYQYSGAKGEIPTFNLVECK